MSYPPPYPPGGWPPPPPTNQIPPPPPSQVYGGYYAQPPQSQAPPPQQQQSHSSSSYDSRRSYDQHQSRRSRSRDRSNRRPSYHQSGGNSNNTGGTSQQNESMEDRQKKMREMLMQQAANRAQAPPPPQPSPPMPPPSYNNRPPSHHQHQGGYSGRDSRPPYNNPNGNRPYNDRGPSRYQGSSSSSSSQFAPYQRPTHHQHGVNPNDKVFLELHVGNLPEMIESEEAFTVFLNEVYDKKNLGPTGAILSTRINRAGHFAFAMFRSKEEATLGLALNGSSCFGSSLRVERPKNYAQKLSALTSSSDGSNGAGTSTNGATATSHLLSLPHQHATPQDIEMLAKQIVQGKGTTIPPQPIPSHPDVTKQDTLVALQKSLNVLGTPSNTLDLLGLPQDPDTLLQIENMCKASGLGGMENVKGGNGRVRVVFSNEREAQKALDVFVNKTFDGRPIDVRFG